MELEIVDVCLNVLNNGDSVVALINKIVISLIPKINHPKKVADFCPISLCKVLHKIILKCLTNRLKGLLNNVISDC